MTPSNRILERAKLLVNNAKEDGSLVIAYIYYIV
jgi:hypothetical protein